MEKLHKTMLFWAYFVGLGALLGAIMFFLDPSGVLWGMNPLLPLLKNGLPNFAWLFDDFTASGFALLFVVGLPNAISVILTHKRSRFAILSNVISSLALILWILLEFYIWGFETLSLIYYIFGVLQLLTALIALRKLKTTTL